MNPEIEILLAAFMAAMPNESAHTAAIMAEVLAAHWGAE